jgi:hypothetical protein
MAASCCEIESLNHRGIESLKDHIHKLLFALFANPWRTLRLKALKALNREGREERPPRSQRNPIVRFSMIQSRDDSMIQSFHSSP